VEKLPFDTDIKKKFISDLSSGLFEKHKSFLSNPLLLSIMLLTYGENAEIPSKLSIFYNQAYEALFQRHDANKGGYSRKRLTDLDIQDFSRVFGLFSLQTYERRIFKLSRMDALSYIEKSRDSLQKEFKAEEYLGDLLSSACLLVEDGLEIAFSHRSFQEYFVALHISSAPPDIQEKLINRYWPFMRSDNVIDLLYEINPELVERVLIIPNLEKLFAELGVKQIVGITHTVRFFKKFYKTLNIEPNTISATCINPKADASTLVHLVAKHYVSYSFPSAEHFNKHHEEMRKKYGNGSPRVEFETASLTSRSPILIDTFKSKGIFSTGYLNSVFQVLKKIKSKHSNTIHNLDVLLGIR
jgi:hypothetical protein